MPKPIRITDELKTKAQAEFTALLDGLKMSDGEIRYSKAFVYQEATATLWLTPLAYSKTVALVTKFSDEVAWHGLAVRQAPNEFVIEDIFIYPQEVTGSTVNTDQDKYTGWLYEFNDETFNGIRMQGHSHVNMGVTPSAVDTGHREKILEQLDADMFYIFMVWNKALKTHTLIYDMENNILYEDGDIIVKTIWDDTMDAFLADAEEKVQKKKPASYRVKPQKNKEQEEIGEPQHSLWDRPYYSSYGHGLHYHDPYEL